MVKYMLILVLLISVIGSKSIAQEANATDEQGLRHGAWAKYYEGTKQLRYSGTFNHGKEEGTFKFYDKSGGHPVATKSYTNGIDDIDVKFYTKEGNLISEGKMNDRSKEGEWRYYHNDGKTIMTTEIYQNNRLEGLRTVFFENGKKAQETIYRNGLKEGKDIHYNETGSVLKEFIYVNDILEGPVKLYNYDGSLLREGNYKANRKHGNWKYYKNGKLDKTVKFPQNKIGVTH